ncbi:ATP-dependent helicase, partial [Candidatus Saccharibacteria bacterium]|nr:ATP-dependent helicase [Candidatus Saccharibacteria bacterium]
MQHDKIFRDKYKQLNEEQKRAVRQTDGPVMVVAGPGTGKTQLLSLRVANILRETDANPDNILCLTFTENGARNMVERLSGFIGTDAYKVVIGTFHAFGVRVIGENREYFAAHLKTPIDELRQHQILSEIVEDLPAHSPLNWVEIHQIISLISELKKAAIEPSTLRQIVQNNIDGEKAVNAQLDDILTPIRGKSARTAGDKLTEIRAAYEQILRLLEDCLPVNSSSLELFATELSAALNEATDNSKPLTAWKDESTTKDSRGRFVLKNFNANRTLLAAADLYQKYQDKLRENGFYDYDDMILELIRALETNDDLRFSLQERFQYILIDEFQDTNASQCRIIELLADNPVNENRPNVMVVGDDDQAIMGFQGAHSANWEIFSRWRDVAKINLTDNYRSSQDILKTAENIAGQITVKPNILKDIIKKLTARQNPTDTNIVRLEFDGEITEMKYIAGEIKKIPVDKWRDVAIIAPKHKLLERIVPFLRAENIAVNYERRENILESKTIQQIVDILELATGLMGDHASVHHLWARVLSQDFWRASTTAIWQLSWEARANHKSWIDIPTNDPHIKFAIEFIKKLSVVAQTENFDTLLGMIVGTVEIDNTASPFKEYYLNQPDDILYDTLTNLTILREKFADFDGGKSANDFLNFVQAHLNASIKITNTDPHRTGEMAVNLMTPHGAKGLEFQHVFLPFLNQKNWASGAGNQNISLPNNLEYIRSDKREDGEKLRVLFVAMTRAKNYLYLTNSKHDFLGKAMERLIFLNDQEDENNNLITPILPEKYQKSPRIYDEETSVSTLDLEKLWHDAWRDKHAPNGADLRELLRDRIEDLVYTATNLTTFYDVKFAGPQSFYENVILGFPSAASDSIEFGNIVHEILDQYARATEKASIDVILEQFARCVNDPSRGISAKTRAKLLEKADWSLPKFFTERREMLSRPARTEQPISAVIDGIKIYGKLDHIEIDDAAKEITIVDFKTGKPKTAKDSSDPTLHKNITQLYFYKMLLENSSEFAKFTVVGGRLEFVEADQTGEILPPLVVKFDPARET